MAKKRIVKPKLKKKTRRKVATALAIIILVLVVAFVATCYFYPPFYEYVKSLLGKKEEKPKVDIRVEGDTAYVSELEDLKVHFVDVGQGDCIIIELPDGKNVLIDAGEDDYDDLKDYIENDTDVEVFDYVIATHADSDHIGNMDDILKDYEVKYVYRPYVYYSGADYTFDDTFNKGGSAYKQKSKTYGRLLDYINKETYTENGETKQAGWEFFNYNSDFAGKISYNETIYEYYFDFLTPRVSDLSEINYSDANDYSPIIKFTYCGVDILFTGDAEKEAEADFVENYKDMVSEMDLDVDILKVGHHGSKSSTTQDFLDIVQPEHAIIQCGWENKYDHPRQDVLNRLNNIDASIYRTDLQGDIVVTINSEGEFSIARNPLIHEDILIGGETLYNNIK